MKVNFKDFTKEEFLELATTRYCPSDFGLKYERNEKCYLTGMDGCEKCWREIVKDIEFKEEVDVIQDSDLEKLFEAIKLISLHYGLEIELDMMVEEASELIKAIMKYKRYKDEDTRKNVVEEIADVYLVMHQLIKLLDIDKEVIEIANKKATRQIERMKKEIGGK